MVVIFWKLKVKACINSTFVVKRVIRYLWAVINEEKRNLSKNCKIKM